MASVVIMKAKQFTEFVRFLKRISILSDDFIIKNNLWIPATRSPESRPGKHVIEGFPIPEEYQSYIYRCNNIRLTSKSLGDITGKKGVIELSISDINITISVAGVDYLIANRENMSIEEFPQSEKSFEELNDAYPWRDIPQKNVNELKQSGIFTLSDDEGNVVRISKGLIRLRGVERKDMDAKYNMKYYIHESSGGLLMLVLHVNYEMCQAVHFYICAKYQKPNYEEPFDTIQ